MLSVNPKFDKPAGKTRYAKGLIAIGTHASEFVDFGFIRAIRLSGPAAVRFPKLAISVFSIALICVSCFEISIISVSAFAIGYFPVSVADIGFKNVDIFVSGKHVIGIIKLGQYKNLF